MLGSTVLDVGIGIVLVYLLLSLVVTSAKEGVATWLHHRAKFLSQGVETLLTGSGATGSSATGGAGTGGGATGGGATGGDATGGAGTGGGATGGGGAEKYRPKGHLFLRLFEQLRWFVLGPNLANTSGLAKEFFNHPLILPFWTDDSPPAYIPSDAFAKVVLDLLQKGDETKLGASSSLDNIQALIGSDRSIFHRTLRALCDAARADTTGINDLAKFSKQLEVWFNHTMDRVSGAYKRHNQFVCFAIALVFTVALNVDTIKITRQLSKEATLRVALSEAAKSHLAVGLQAPSNGGEKDFNKTLAEVTDRTSELKNLGIPLGWNQTLGSNVDTAVNNPARTIPKTLGLLMTALAATLGAPFWFDVLNKFVAIRGVGKSPNENPKSPKKEEG